MSYTPTEWQPGDIVTSVKLNKIETELVTLDGDTSQLKSQINDIAEEGTEIIKPSSSGVTRYPTDGYIRRNDGALVSHASYWDYTFQTTSEVKVFFANPDGWTQIAVYNGDAFDTTKFVVCKASSVSDLPTAESPLTIASGMTVAICVSANSSFELSVLLGTYVIKDTSKPKIKIVPQYASSFHVDVLDEKSGKYLKYWFYHTVNEDPMTYGSGQTKTVKTYDVWFNNNIVDDSGTLVFQGNTNFIHALNEAGHIGFVGAGHGCTVMDCYQFFADGMPFDPAVINGEINCDTFRFVIKAKHYKIDDSITVSSSHAMPVLDENGDPIVTSEWVFDGTWTVNNRIEMKNHLGILVNGIQFRQCDAGMLCGYFPNINNVMANGRKGLYWTAISESGGVYTSTDKSGSGVTFEAGEATTAIADDCTIFGNTYVARQYYWQRDNNQSEKENVLVNMAPNADSRIKIYFMPCVCEESLAAIADGMTVDTFNTGDSIDVFMVRSIEITPN